MIIKHDKQTDITAAIDSVDLINNLCEKEMIDIDEIQQISNNIEHLIIIIERHSLNHDEAEIFKNAIESGRKKLDQLKI